VARDTLYLTSSSFVSSGDDGMACFITPTDRDAPAYHGVGRIFEYTNFDGRMPRTNCGLAAAATFLTFHSKIPPIEQRAHQVMRLIERDHPPDNLAGLFGTSRRRVQRICRAYGIRTKAIEGEAALRAHVAYGNPVIVLLGVTGQLCGFNLPMAHWMVVYGYDENNVFVTNWGQYIGWDVFRQNWNHLFCRLVNMGRRGLVALPPRL
jgi:hypothetical protein